MTARIQLHLFTEERGRIDAAVFLTALDASLEILKELDATVSGGKFRWYYTHLSIGSGVSVQEGELPPDQAEAEVLEQQIEGLYLEGLASFDVAARLPTAFTNRAIEASWRLVSVLSNGVSHMDITGAHVKPHFTITERAVANLKELMGRGFTDIGSIEGKLETISLAQRPTFNVRDEVTGQSVICSFTMDRFDEVRDALGRRVLVSGEVTYHRRGEPTEVSPVDDIRLLDETEPPTVDEIRGIEPEITEGMPAGLYVRKRFYGT